jgi:hypothetical protein
LALALLFHADSTEQEPDMSHSASAVVAISDAKFEQRIRDLESEVLELQTRFVDSQSVNPGEAWVAVSRVLTLLVQRLLQLETFYMVLRNSLAAQRHQPPELDTEALDRALRDLSRKSLNGHPNFSFLNSRFRDFEIALSDIRNLAASRDAEYVKRHPPAETGGPAMFPLRAKACTEEDLRSEWAAHWSQEMQMPVTYQRKCWELCYVSQVLYNEGKLQQGARGLGFACADEPLPSLFAKYGVRVLATDFEPGRAEGQAWRNGGLNPFAKLRRTEICRDEARLASIETRHIDLRKIPPDLHGQFDFCWSIGVVEHLGSIENGLQFVENSILTLKPGGISIHITEFNVHDEDTVDNWPTVFFQKRHFLDLAERLKQRGLIVYEFDFDTGKGILDGFVDLPPFFDANHPLQNAHAHLKLSIDGFVCTSFGLVVKKPIES